MIMPFWFFRFLLSDLIARALDCLKTRTTANDSDLVRGSKVQQNRCSFVAIMFPYAINTDKGQYQKQNQKWGQVLAVFF